MMWYSTIIYILHLHLHTSMLSTPRFLHTQSQLALRFQDLYSRCSSWVYCNLPNLRTWIPPFNYCWTRTRLSPSPSYSSSSLDTSYCPFRFPLFSSLSHSLPLLLILPPSSKRDVKSSLPHPAMIPSLLPWRLDLQARILNRHAAMSKHALLLHRDTVQSPCVLGPRCVEVAEGFDGRVH